MLARPAIPQTSILVNPMHILSSNHRRALVAVREPAAFHHPLKSPVVWRRRRRCVHMCTYIHLHHHLSQTGHAIVRVPLDFPIMPPPDCLDLQRLVYVQVRR